ncbi:endo-1,4-beta-xylanase [Nocardia sp. NPDC050697]|uniref:endo-1,4-beta-xylanase n=1 Tax=Nocardia sp. NPDC050697 TaxID=3155158 RepID=UPI0033CFCE39
MGDETEVAETVREPITQRETVLFRPIIRAWAPNGDVTPQAFKLSTADKADSNRLSIAHGDTTAEDAYNERAAAVKKRCDDNGKPYHAPVGVLAVTVEDVESIEIKSPEESEPRRPLTVWDDSMNDHIPDTHGHIDYDNLPPSDRGAYDFAAKALLDRAKKKGWKFGPCDE